MRDAPQPLAPVLASLPAMWRARAAQLRQWAAADSAARALELAADELEDALRSEADAVLTLEQAADESGYSADHLGRLIRSGEIPNAGRPHAPRIRRGELPRKAGTLRSAPVLGISRAHIARSVVNRSTGE